MTNIFFLCYKETTYIMNIIFELHTTINDPLKLTVNSYCTLNELYEKIIQLIDKETIFNEKDIVSIFAESKKNDTVLNIPKKNICINTFLLDNRDYFPINIDSINTYKLYIIDYMYSERLRKDVIPEPKKKTIKTSHNISFQKLLPFW